MNVFGEAEDDATQALWDILEVLHKIKDDAGPVEWRSIEPDSVRIVVFCDEMVEDCPGSKNGNYFESYTHPNIEDYPRCPYCGSGMKYKETIIKSGVKK